MDALFDLILNNFIGYLIVVGRVTGMFTFNPIFGRANVPMPTRTAMSLVLALVMFSAMGGTTGIVVTGIVPFVMLMVKETLVGLVFGFMVNLILTVLVYAGEIVDNQIGLGMAKAMDPSTGIQMPVFANLFTYLFILYFFVIGGHLDYIQLFKLSYEAIPIDFSITANTLSMIRIIAEYLGTVLELAAKLAMPVVATELIVEFGIGIMMKAVPSIQVLVVNIQLKVLIGLFVLMSIAIPISDFLNELFGILRGNLYGILEGFL